MSYALEKRIQQLETQLSSQGDVLIALHKSSQAAQVMFEALHNANASSVEASQQQFDLTMKIRNDLSFSMLMIYWIMHVLERVEKVVPYATLDLIMNSVENNMDIGEVNFIEIFQGLREAGIEDAAKS